MMSSHFSSAYQHLQSRIASEQCIVLDGGISTELQRTGIPGYRVNDKELWGTDALYRSPHAVLKVHQRYVAAGCDIISTNTWGILKAPELEARQFSNLTSATHWIDMARLGLRLARQAIQESSRADELALAFTISGDINTPQRLDTLRLLTRVFQDDPPDLILMETLSLIREDLTFPAVTSMVETGVPVWLSFRRCRHGVCGVHGQHWGGPEGDLFGRAARRFEEMGVGALLINCLPFTHVPGMLPWLRDFTDLPLGVYPNLGRYLDPGWKFDDEVEPQSYARLALEWRAEGAQIVGGCCGVTPEHIAAAQQALQGTRPGKLARPTAYPAATAKVSETPDSIGAAWTDEQGRNLYPLPFPAIIVDPGVFRPTQGSFLLWKHLFKTGIGRDKVCLDIGCGTGILTVQLALNGARHVQAIDIQREAVTNTLANAYRNQVAGQVTAETVDLYSFLPTKTYELIVASLYQMPVDPLGELSSHRPADFWGRNLLDHLISLLPELLEEEGVAYIMQISILGQLRTAELLAKAGMDSQVIDYAFFQFSPVFYENSEQIRRVEQLSDAYHLKFGDDDVIVMYLLEVRRKDETAK
jgi:S-methylmethionine-dependent homocysteine/selenocysteine methylase/SAM-dependent methyltransferase